MPYCRNCNTKLQPNRDSCPNCGEPMSLAEKVAVNVTHIMFNTKDTTYEFAPEDIEQNIVMAMLSYLNLLVLVPLLAANGSKFARFHANQGIVLLILSIACNALVFILIPIPPLLFIVLPFQWILNTAFLIMIVIGIVNSLQGKARELPLIGSIKILK